MQRPGGVVAQHAGLGGATQRQQEERVGPDHLVGLHGGQGPRGLHLQGLLPRLLHLGKDTRAALASGGSSRWAAVSARQLPYLLPGGGLLLAEVFFAAAVAHQVPGAAPDAAVAAVPGPAAAEVADAVVALAAGVAATAWEEK